MRDLRIATWNVHRRRECLFEAFSDDSVDVLAAQKAPAGGRKKDAPGSVGYWKIWGGGRAAIYINKRWSRTEWSPVVVEEDVVAVRVGDTHVVSVYSEGYLRSWTTPLNLLLRMSPLKKPIVVGDFNLHHSRWDTDERTSTGVDKLLDLAVRWDLTLATPKGEPMWESPGRRQSTLDLIWFGQDTSVRYEGAADWAGFDHYTQLVLVQSGSRPKPIHEKFDWSMMRTADTAKAERQRRQPSKTPNFYGDLQSGDERGVTNLRTCRW